MGKEVLARLRSSLHCPRDTDVFCGRCSSGKHIRNRSDLASRYDVADVGLPRYHSYRRILLHLHILKGFENKGIMEGVRYGFYIRVWMSVGMAYGTYAMVAIPYSLALQWFIYGVIEYIIAGVALALVFKGGKPKAA